MKRPWKGKVSWLLHLQHLERPYAITYQYSNDDSIIRMLGHFICSQQKHWRKIKKVRLMNLLQEAGLNINSYTYDGDTPANIRQKVRKAGHIVITNPDMLHSGIFPHHTKWVSLFENLKYIYH